LRIKYLNAFVNVNGPKVSKKYLNIHWRLFEA